MYICIYIYIYYYVYIIYIYIYVCICTVESVYIFVYIGCTRLSGRNVELLSRVLCPQVDKGALVGLQKPWAS